MLGIKEEEKESCIPSQCPEALKGGGGPQCSGTTSVDIASEKKMEKKLGDTGGYAAQHTTASSRWAVSH